MKNFNLLAIIAFVASILSLFVVFKILAAVILIVIGILLGAVAIAQIIKHDEDGLFLAILSIILSLGALAVGIYLMIYQSSSVSLI